MKKLTIVFLVAVIGTTRAIAQDTTSMATHKMNHMAPMKMKKDAVMMENGKMMVMKGGKTMAMDQEMTLTDGSTVTADGMLKMQDGTSKQLKNGDCVYMDGKMAPMMKKGSMHKKPATPQ